MSHDRSFLGVRKKINIRLPIEAKVQNEKVIWPILSCLPNSAGKWSECERPYKQ